MRAPLTSHLSIGLPMNVEFKVKLLNTPGKGYFLTIHGISNSRFTKPKEITETRTPIPSVLE